MKRAEKPKFIASSSVYYPMLFLYYLAIVYAFSRASLVSLYHDAVGRVAVALPVSVAATYLATSVAVWVIIPGTMAFVHTRARRQLLSNLD